MAEATTDDWATSSGTTWAALTDAYIEAYEARVQRLIDLLDPRDESDYEDDDDAEVSA
jgi:hypothetical protein